MGVPSEKHVLPVVERPAAAPAKRSWRKPVATALFALLALPYFYPSLSPFNTFDDGKTYAPISCEQAKPILPQAFNVSDLVVGKKDQIVTWLSDAVKVPTEIYDVMGEIGEDERWDVFYKFAEYLEKAFPLVHKHLTRTRVVTHALVFEWEGSDKSLKPLLITGHQDVVPVLPATRGLWTHDPFGGEFDGEKIWGRGAADDKSGTIGSLSAVELLLQSGKFQPTRTVIFAYGCDEETGGKVGAYNLGKWIEAKYGKDSIAMLVDEGSGIQEVYGQLFAAPAVGEKGYLDVELKVETLGGHSSIPPIHTGIGFTSLLIAEIEKNPHEPYLNPESPLVTMISCAADYAPKIPSTLQKAIRKVTESLSVNGKVDWKALRKVQDWWVTGSYEDGIIPKGMGKAMVSTTQATDIINGGVKVNALPEVVTTYINHRISLASSVAELQAHLTKVLSPVAAKYNLALDAFGKDVELKHCSMHATTEAKAGKITLSEAFHSSLDPAPVSPYTVDDAGWRLLSGTVKGVYATRSDAHLSAEEASKELHMAPTISTGNTDTKRYWNLTRNIYRFAYLSSTEMANFHTVDEWMGADNFVEQVRWFMTFIVNVDESREI